MGYIEPLLLVGNQVPSVSPKFLKSNYWHKAVAPPPLPRKATSTLSV